MKSIKEIFENGGIKRIYRPIVILQDYTVRSAGYLRNVFEDHMPEHWEPLMNGFIGKNFLVIEGRIKEVFGDYYQNVK